MTWEKIMELPSWLHTVPASKKNAPGGAKSLARPIGTCHPALQELIWYCLFIFIWCKVGDISVRVRNFLGLFFLVLGFFLFYGRGHGFLTCSLFSITFPWFFIGFPSFFLTFSSFSGIFLWFFIIFLTFSSFSITFPWFFIIFLTFSLFSTIFP